MPAFSICSERLKIDGDGVYKHVVPTALFERPISSSTELTDYDLLFGVIKSNPLARLQSRNRHADRG